MNETDPFAIPNSDHTVIMPNPGGRAHRLQPTPSPYPQTKDPLPGEDAAALNSGLNPLLAAANPLLNLVAQLRTTLQHPDPSELRDQLAHGIKAFEMRAKAAGIASEKIIAARYVLCTLLDETAASTPWGGSGLWARHSLLVMFHKEAWGGEKFFQLLSKLAENIKDNRDLLELMYVCLALGFEGRFRIVDNGRVQLDTLRERLAEMLKKQRGDYERDLSAYWKPAMTQRSPIFTALPLWVAFAVCGSLLIGTYSPFLYSLHATSDPVADDIRLIRAKSTPPPAKPALQPRLATFLAPDIRQELVTVQDYDNRSIVTLRGDGLFATGSTEVSAEYQTLLVRIAEALNRVPGQVLITGHTDNQPIRRSLRFPSNWDLSLERARSVEQLLLTQSVAPTRLTVEGRADSEPVAPNDTEAGRSRNRRVEITLFDTGARQ